MNLEVVFPDKTLEAVEFESDMPMTDEIFEVFQERNLPVNTWPYLRAFVSDSVSRMGWPPVTMPAFKIGTGDSDGELD